MQPLSRRNRHNSGLHVWMIAFVLFNFYVNVAARHTHTQLFFREGRDPLRPFEAVHLDFQYGVLRHQLRFLGLQRFQLEAGAGQGRVLEDEERVDAENEERRHEDAAYEEPVTPVGCSFSPLDAVAGYHIRPFPSPWFRCCLGRCRPLCRVIIFTC